jgi:hypothetical protein
MLTVPLMVGRQVGPSTEALQTVKGVKVSSAVPKALPPDFKAEQVAASNE